MEDGALKDTAEKRRNLNAPLDLCHKCEAFEKRIEKLEAGAVDWTLVVLLLCVSVDLLLIFGSYRSILSDERGA